MNKLKFWLEQTMMISFAIYLGIVIEGVVYLIFKGEALSTFSLSWYQLISVILTGALCSLLTLFLLSDYEGAGKRFLIKVIIHSIGLYLIVSFMGWIFNWYTGVTGFIMVTLIFLMVYVFVWLVSLWFYKREEVQINKALDDIRDEE